MSRRPAKLVLATLALVPLLALAPAADAQSIWLDRVSPRTLHLEIAKPLYENGEEADFLTANWSLSGRFPLGSNMHAVLEIPYARLGADEGLFSEDASTTIGNLYAGVESDPKSPSGTWFEAGVRLPTASDAEFVTLTGSLVDADRWEAYGLGTEAWILHTAVHWRSDPVGKVGADLRAAPNLWVGGHLDDVEFFVLYGGQVLYHGATARAGAGLTGRWLTTGTADDDMTHQLEAAADFLSGRVRPGVTLRLPIDDEYIGTDAVIGVTVTVVLD